MINNLAIPISEARVKLGQIVKDGTYLEPQVLKYTRDFTDQEIAQWQKADQNYSESSEV